MEKERKVVMKLRDKAIAYACALHDFESRKVFETVFNEESIDIVFNDYLYEPIDRILCTVSIKYEELIPEIDELIKKGEKSLKETLATSRQLETMKYLELKKRLTIK